MKMVKHESVDAYLSSVPAGPFRDALMHLRQIILQEVPEAEESISYGMPGYKLNGVLAYFAAFNNHLSFFPGGIVQRYAEELKAFKTSKGTIQFTPDHPLPDDLVRRIIRDRVQENLSKKRT